MMSTGCDAPVSSETATVSRFDPYRLHRLKSLDEHRRERRRRIRQLVGRLLLIVSLLGALVLLLLLLSGCQTIDPREECCEEVRLIYRYVRTPVEGDVYRQHVTGGMRHFLYNGKGEFIREVTARPQNPQVLRLKQLPVGSYTMLTVGNAGTERTDLSGILRQGVPLRAATLALLKESQKSHYGQADELFYNQRSFRSEKNKEHIYYCDLANVHCHLHVKVEWEVRPPYTEGPYTLRLSNVTTGYAADGARSELSLVIAGAPGETPSESTYTDVVHRFPLSLRTWGVHTAERSLFNAGLTYEMITLRYTDRDLPLLRLYHGSEPVSEEIDLERAFRQWQWHPDRHPEQIYRIRIKIRPDGSVILRPWGTAGVMDWEDGGSISHGIK